MVKADVGTGGHLRHKKKGEGKERGRDNRIGT